MRYLLLACVLWSVPASAQPVASAFVIGANTLDAASTIQALQHPQLSEANPMLGSKLSTILPLKIALTAVEVYEVRALAKAGHPKAAQIVAAGLTVVITGVAVRNESVIAKRAR